MYFVHMNNFKTLRKAQGISIKSTGLNARTVNRIESGSEKVTVEHLRRYLEAIGLRLCYCVAE